MKTIEIRKKFFNFLKEKGHVVVSSSSLIPDDPSVLLTTAGMQQFKKYYTGELSAVSDFKSQRTISIQKCFRTSDIEEIGDETHLSFFEMLGNFSFGPVGSDDPENLGTDGYFKKSSIFWGYEFITNILEINKTRIKVSVFGGDSKSPFDEESFRIWRDDIGISEDKIIKGSREDNFWGPTGNEGPCGPCTEIYVDGVEIWNIVFNEYYKNKEGFYHKIDKPGVDTGMGLERLAAILQGVKSVYEIDVFLPLIQKIGELAPQTGQKTRRILADHLRGSIFLIADGVRPSNKEAGYILRRLLRRIMAIEIKNDIHADLFPESVSILKNIYGDIYSEFKKEKEIVLVLENEKQKFHEALSKGIKEIEKLKEINGKEAFYLYETFGLPFELIVELAPQDATKNLQKEDFDKEFEKHQEISRAGVEKKFGGHGLTLDTGELKAGTEEEMEKVIRLHTATHLLHWALRKILGKEVKQAGSDINPERLRFDFLFERKLIPEEIKQIEDLINKKIKEDLLVYYKEMPKEEAENINALAFFKQKYPPIVKVYFIGAEESGGVLSKEFCGGPHVGRTSEIGQIKIIKEESVGAGLRRIRAIAI